MEHRIGNGGRAPPVAELLVPLAHRCDLRVVETEREDEVVLWRPLGFTFRRGVLGVMSSYRAACAGNCFDRGCPVG